MRNVIFLLCILASIVSASEKEVVIYNYTSSDGDVIKEYEDLSLKSGSQKIVKLKKLITDGRLIEKEKISFRAKEGEIARKESFVEVPYLKQNQTGAYTIETDLKKGVIVECVFVEKSEHIEFSLKVWRHKLLDRSVFNKVPDWDVGYPKIDIYQSFDIKDFIAFDGELMILCGEIFNEELSIKAIRIGST